MCDFIGRGIPARDCRSLYSRARAFCCAFDMPLVESSMLLRHVGHVGDPDDISLVGQSAGAHLTALVMLRQALGDAPGGATSSTRRDGEAEAPGGAAGWLRRWVGISGPYEVGAIIEEMHQRGLQPPGPTLERTEGTGGADGGGLKAGASATAEGGVRDGDGDGGGQPGMGRASRGASIEYRSNYSFSRGTSFCRGPSNSMIGGGMIGLPGGGLVGTQLATAALAAGPRGEPRGGTRAWQ